MTIKHSDIKVLNFLTQNLKKFLKICLVLQKDFQHCENFLLFPLKTSLDFSKR